MIKTKRLYCIGDVGTLPEFENIPVHQIVGLVNTSIDHIHIDNINKYTKNDAIKIIQISLEKLRPKGLLSIQIYNYSHICKLYSDNAITDDKLISYISGNQCIFSIPMIISLLDSAGAKVSELNFSADQFTIDLVSEKK